MCVNRVWGVMLWNGWFAWEMITGRVKEWGLGQKMVICSEEQNVNLMWMEGIIPFLVLIEGDANLLSAQRTRQFRWAWVFKGRIQRGMIHYGLRGGRDWMDLKGGELRVGWNREMEERLRRLTIITPFRSPLSYPLFPSHLYPIPYSRRTNKWEPSSSRTTERAVRKKRSYWFSRVLEYCNG